MEIEIKRTDFSPLSTIGEMYINGKFFCYTLEDKVRDVKIKGITAIPAGEYGVILTVSARFGVLMPLLLNVKGFDGVRIHNGNTDKDTEGCILVGKTKGKDFIGSSRTAFTELMKLLKKEKTIKLTIK